jgi:hypothetical protein
VDTKSEYVQAIGPFSGYSRRESHYALAVSEIEPPSREIQRVPRHVLAQRADGAVEAWRDDSRYRGEHGSRDYVDDHDLDEPGTDWSQQLAVLRRHRVTLACLALILGSLIWKAGFLSHYFYWEDDFEIFDVSLKSRLSWDFLTNVDAGHFFPGVHLIAWVLSRVALYNWRAGTAVVLAMHAAAGLAAWRLLRTLLGNRPAILIPLVLYLFSPLAFPTDAWWITAVEAIPLQIALFMALNSHLHYVWTGKFRYAAASAAWQFFGLFFFEKSAVIPLLLFAVTAGFLTSRRLLPGLRATVVRLWKGWLLYLGLLGVYAAVFLNALGKSTNGAEAPAPHAISTFAWKQVFRTLLPGLFGGPWHWYHPLNYASAFADPPTFLSWAAMVGALAIIVASILTRRRAWRAWAILAAWIVLADMAPVFIGRLKYPDYAGLLGLTTRYVVDAPAVLAITMALAFWPVAGPERDQDGNAGRRREFFTGRWKAVAIATVAVFAVGSVYSVQQFQTQTNIRTVTSTQVYIANARAALADAPAGTVIVSQHVPLTVMDGFFGGAAVTSVVLGPLSKRGSQISWTSQPAGPMDELRVFGPDGRLWPAAILGSATAKMTWRQSCVTPKRSRVVLPFQPVSVSFAEVLRIAYVARAALAGQVVTVRYGNFSGQFTVRSGLHKVYFPVHGSAPNVVVQAQSPFGGLCFGSAAAGYVGPFPGDPIPSSAPAARG